MTEQEYEKLVRAVSNKYMADVFPCNPVAPASFEAGVKWTRENPGPEVQALAEALRASDCTCRLYKREKAPEPKLSFFGGTEIAICPRCEALTRLKERTAGKGEG